VWSTAGIGAVLIRGPANQSTCEHLGRVMKNESTVKNGRCDFYEPYSQTNSWRILDADDNIIPQNGGAYYVAVWLQENTSGKMGIALGTWVENFITPFEIAQPTCSRTLLDWSEKKGDQEVCLPVRTCTVGTKIENKTCVTQGACRAGSCEDTLASNALCTRGKMCSCPDLIKTNPCGTVYKSDTGDVPTNSVCSKTCNTCSEPYTPTMGCGGASCPAAVKVWDKANMDMHTGMAIKFTGDVGVDFVRGMIPHHRGAMEMCRVLLEELSCEEDGALSGLVHFCSHVGRDQESEVQGLLKYLSDKGMAEKAPCTMRRLADDEEASLGDEEDDLRRMAMGEMMMGCGNVTCPSSKQFMEANQLMQTGMSLNFSCQNDVDFARGMIPHHAGAVAMCDVLKAFSSKVDPFLQKFCAKITEAQRSERAFLAQWLVARGNDVSASCESCENKTQPELPCEDMLPESSFCHVLGGDTYCTCESVVASHACGTNVEISGFGRLNVTAECMRTCGACPATRPPLFHSPCPQVPPMGLSGGSGDMGGSGESGDMGGMVMGTTTGPKAVSAASGVAVGTRLGSLLVSALVIIRLAR